MRANAARSPRLKLADDFINFADCEGWNVMPSIARFAVKPRATSNFVSAGSSVRKFVIFISGLQRKKTLAGRN